MEHGAIILFGQMRDEEEEEDSVQTVDLRLACRLAAGENTFRHSDRSIYT